MKLIRSDASCFTKSLSEKIGELNKDEAREDWLRNALK